MLKEQIINITTHAEEYGSNYEVLDMWLSRSHDHSTIDLCVRTSVHNPKIHTTLIFHLGQDKAEKQNIKYCTSKASLQYVDMSRVAWDYLAVPTIYLAVTVTSYFVLFCFLGRNQNFTASFNYAKLELFFIWCSWPLFEDFLGWPAPQ